MPSIDKKSLFDDAPVELYEAFSVEEMEERLELLRFRPSLSAAVPLRNSWLKRSIPGDNPAMESLLAPDMYYFMRGHPWSTRFSSELLAYT